MLARLALACLVVAGAGCSFDATVSSDTAAHLRCTRAEDCPPDWACREALGACVPRERIDGTAPTFAAAPVVAPRFAGVGVDVVVTFAATEVLARPPAVRLVDTAAARPFVDDAGDDVGIGPFSFRYTPTGAEVEGDAAVLVDLVDPGGDATFGALAGVVTLDFTAPQIVAGSASFTVAPPPGALSPTTTHLVSGGTVDVSFRVDDVSAVASVSLARRPPAAPLAVPFATVVVAGADARAFHLDVSGIDVPAGDYDVVAHLVDAAGNVSDTALDTTPLPADAVVPSPCVALDSAGAPRCTDDDGDGVFGVGAACPSGTDCNDDDPLTFPGAFEIPGDGVDNGCAGTGDAPLDESVAVFVAPGGDDAADGSRSTPLRTVAAGAALAGSARRSFLALASGAYDTAPLALSDVGVLGGRDPVTWARASASSAVTFASCGDPLLSVGATTSTPTVLEGITVTAACPGAGVVVTSGDAVLRDVAISVGGDALDFEGGHATIVRADIETDPTGQATAFVAGGDATVISSTIAAGDGGDGSDLFGHVVFLRDHIFGSLNFGAGSDVKVRGSVVDMHTGDFTSVTYGLAVEASTMRVTDPSAFFLSQSSDEGAPVTALLDDVFVGPGSGFSLFNGATGLQRMTVDDVVPGPCFANTDGSCRSVSEVASCSFVQCVSAEIVDVDPLLGDDLRPSAGSPIAAAGAPYDDTSLAIDIDGNCRDTAHPDLGAFVVPP